MSSYKWSHPGERGKLKKGPWTFEEDIRLLRYIKIHGEGRWSALAKAAGLQRCGKSCRLRWVNYLRPDLKRGSITPDEERMIIDLHARWGNRWSLIADRIPGRTDNEIKNYWRSHLRRKLQSTNGSRQYNDQTPNSKAQPSQPIHELPAPNNSPPQTKLMPTVTSSPSHVQAISTVNSCLNDYSNTCGLKTDIPEPHVTLQSPAAPATVPANQSAIHNNVQNEPGAPDEMLEPRLYTCPSFEPDSLSLLLCQFYSGFGFEGKDNAVAACSSLPSVSDVTLIPAALCSSRDYESDACMDFCTDLLWNIDPICPPPLEDAELLLDQL